MSDQNLPLASLEVEHHDAVFVANSRVPYDYVSIGKWKIGRLEDWEIERLGD